METIGLYCFIGAMAWSIVNCLGPSLIPVENSESEFPGRTDRWQKKRRK
jgi:hypothetical protein